MLQCLAHHQLVRETSGRRLINTLQAQMFVEIGSHRDQTISLFGEDEGRADATCDGHESISIVRVDLDELVRDVLSRSVGRYIGNHHTKSEAFCALNDPELPST